MRLTAARRRTRRYLEKHGARASIERKVGAAWEPVADAVPVMVQMGAVGPSGIDPYTATSDQYQAPRLSFPHDTDVAVGDRVTLAGGRGTVPELVTIAALVYGNLDVTRDAMGATEELAVETHTVTIQRWDDTAGEYRDVLTADARAVTTDVGALDTSNRGSTATVRRGTLVFEPVPAEPIGEGDWILGIPWASGATVTVVRPIVGDRLEVQFRFTA